MKPGILVLGRKRPGFDGDWATAITREIDAALADAPYPSFTPAVRIVDEETLRTAVRECIAAGTDALVVIQPTMSDGNLAATLAQIWDAPVILWATPEKQTGAMISACSLVGAHTFASTLRQLEHPFELVYGMPGHAETMADLERALRLCSAWRLFQHGRIGLIGYHAPGFIDMQADPFQLKRNIGLQLRHIGLTEFMAALNSFDEETVQADVNRVHQLGLRRVDVEEDELPLASRYYLTMKDMIESNALDALALRCWPELPGVVGQWPYLAMARLATEGHATACEGDVDGGVSLLAGEALGFGQTALSDWLEHDRDTITLWHAGNAPFGLCEAPDHEFGPRIARHFNNHKAAVVDANLRVGLPITIHRFWRCDQRYHLTAFEAETIPPKRLLKGTNGLARVAAGDVRERFDELIHAGMPHHVAISAGHHAETLRRFARLLNIEFLA